MLSRVAENLYWLGRYLERAENAARMADVEYHASVETGARGIELGSMWEALIAATGALTDYERARASDPALSPADFLILADANSQSIRSVVGHARSLARALREHISREVFEEINLLHLALQRRSAFTETDLYDLCREVRRGVQTALGLYDNTALHDEGREWFRCGLFLERADMTSRILDSKYHVLLPSVSEVGGPLDRFQWMAVLRSASAWEAYGKVTRSGVSGPGVVGMLIFQPEFPRSLVFCLAALRRHFERATALTPAAQSVHAQRVLTLLALDLAAYDIHRVVLEGLHEFLDQFQARLIQADRAITEHIFRVMPEAVA